jgi:hypothetical protein
LDRGAESRKPHHVVSDRGHDDDLETGLLFFLKVWALSHPAVEFELYYR